MIFLTASASERNQIDSKQEQITAIASEADTAEAETGRLAAYTDFGALRDRRIATVTQLTGQRTNWAHQIGEIARVMPSNVWFSSLTGQDGSVVTATAPATPDADGATIDLAGCTVGHRSVSSVMSAMRRIDRIKKVTLTSTEKGGSASGGGGGGGGGGGQCSSKKHTLVTFAMKLTFKPNEAPATGASGAQGATTPAAATGAQPAAPAPTSPGSVK